ncbi:hypothetical protein B0O80DRAFT_496100 [Mortierella sp. GBAus27b]|nr:hypothetical protein BGX31_008959 [Mortierella sp. GBA43]KAI8358343.1 hypothetical protein B0O80DRAFT_496100 [Mortierella sp. GBAus27b]
MSISRWHYITILFQCLLFEFGARVPEEKCACVATETFATCFSLAAGLSKRKSRSFLSIPSDIYIERRNLDRPWGVGELIDEFNNMDNMDYDHLFPYHIDFEVEGEVWIPGLTDPDINSFLWRYARQVPLEYHDDIAIIVSHVRSNLWKHNGSGGITTRLPLRGNELAVVKFTRAYSISQLSPLSRIRLRECEEARMRQSTTRPQEHKEPRPRQSETRPRKHEETRSRHGETRPLEHEGSRFRESSRHSETHPLDHEVPRSRQSPRQSETSPWEQEEPRSQQSSRQSETRLREQEVPRSQQSSRQSETRLREQEPRSQQSSRQSETHPRQATTPSRREEQETWQTRARQSVVRPRHDEDQPLTEDRVRPRRVVLEDEEEEDDEKVWGHEETRSRQSKVRQRPMMVPSRHEEQELWQTHPRQSPVRTWQDEGQPLAQDRVRPRRMIVEEEDQEEEEEEEEEEGKEDEEPEKTEKEERVYECLNPLMERLQREQVSSRYRDDQVQDLKKRIQDYLNNCYPDRQLTLEFYGSFANGLGSSTSDVDMVVWDSSNFLDVEILKAAFRRHGYQGVNALPGAKVPIVTFHDPEVHITCDLCINEGLGVENSRLINTYQSIDPRVRTTWLTLKQIAATYGILSGKRLLLSSYGLALMLITFLQTIDPPVLPNLQQQHPERKVPKFVNGHDCSFDRNWPNYQSIAQDNRDTPAELLMSFLEYFGNRFDYEQWEINPRLGKIQLRKKTPKWHIVVMDPFDLAKNVTCNIKLPTVQKIKKAFQDAHRALMEEKWDQVTNTSYLAGLI